MEMALDHTASKCGAFYTPSGSEWRALPKRKELIISTITAFHVKRKKIFFSAE